MAKSKSTIWKEMDTSLKEEASVKEDIGSRNLGDEDERENYELYLRQKEEEKRFPLQNGFGWSPEPLEDEDNPHCYDYDWDYEPADWDGDFDNTEDFA